VKDKSVSFSINLNDGTDGRSYKQKVNVQLIEKEAKSVEKENDKNFDDSVDKNNFVDRAEDNNFVDITPVQVSEEVAAKFTNITQRDG